MACKIHWTKELDALLGTDSDARVAKHLGIHIWMVRRRRKMLGIPPFGPQPIPHWGTTELEMLGRLPDDELAKLFGRTVESVKRKRFEIGR